MLFWHILTRLTALACVLVCGVANAEPFCSGLKKVLGTITQQFIPVRTQPFNWALGEWRGAVTLGPLTTCSTKSDGEHATYECEQRNLPDDEANARRILDDLDRELIQCLGSEWKKGRVRKTSYEYKNLRTLDDISLGYRRVQRHGRPVSYAVQLEISFIDANPTK
jgi:hypothetical protein